MKQTTIAKEWDWEKEFDETFLELKWLQLPLHGTILERIKYFISKVEAQTRETTLDECLEIIGEDERQREYITDLGIKDDFEGVRGLIRNKLRQDLRQAINSLQVTKK